MANKSLLHWCQSALPPNYQSIKGLTEKYQNFLAQQLPEELVDAVQVINVDRDEVVIAAASGQIANYLRLHVRELTQQFHETFGGNRKLSIKAMPASLLKVESGRVVARPQSVSTEAINNIENNAKWVEDEKLKRALESLAHQLKKSNPRTD
jgi:hypothetical protein